MVNIVFQNEHGAYNLFLKEDDVMEILNCNCFDGDFHNAFGGIWNPKKEIIQALKIEQK